jgi:hypothetical protein
MINTFRTGISFLTIAVLSSVSGCQKDEDALTISNKQDIIEEAQVESYYNDMDNLAAVAIDAPTEAEYSGGRTSGTITIEDARFNCDGVVITIEPGATSTVDAPYGVLTVDFGTGCTDLQGNVRKGKLIFTYDKWRFTPGSKVITTTENYFVNNIKLEGTRTSVNVTPTENDAPKFHVILENGKATFPNGAIALRNSDITWSWIRGASPALDKLIIHANSAADGITGEGRSYSVSVVEQLEYKRFCGLAVSGLKKYIVDGGKEITINYGTGTCDNTINVGIDGKSYVVTIAN